MSGGFWGRLFSTRAPQVPAAAPLRGVPKTRRLKNYQAESGYTWSYYFEGYRLEETPESARSYRFTLLAGGREPQELSVVIRESALSRIREHAGREISSPEMHALAKMHLFSILDREEPPGMGSRWELDAAEAEAIWARLEL